MIEGELGASGQPSSCDMFDNYGICGRICYQLYYGVRLHIGI